MIVDESSRKIKALSVLVIILLLVVIGLLVYILYDKKINNVPADNTPNNEREVTPKDDEEDTTKVDENEIEVEPSKDIKVNEDIVKKANTFLNTTINTEGRFAYNFLREANGSINDMDNDDKLSFVELYFLGRFDKLTSDDILKELKSLFGKDFTIEFKNIKCALGNDHEDFIYNEKTKKYTANEDNAHGFDFDLGIVLKSKLIDYKEENSKYLLTYKQLFKDGTSDASSIVNFKGDMLHDYSEEYGTTSIEEFPKITDSDFAKYEDKLVPVTYTFEMEDGNLVLKSVNY